MRRRFPIVVIATGLVLVGLRADVLGQGRGGGGGGGGNTPPPVLVTSTVHNDIGNTLQSDLGAAYTASSQILSQIYSQSGDWTLDLREQTARTVHLTFISTEPPVGSGPYPQTGLYNARVFSRCFVDGDSGGEGFFEIAPGQSNPTCSLRIVFTVSGTQYVLVSSPLQAGTNWATVACVAPADPNAPCTGWRITPGSNPDPWVTTPRAVLLRVAKNGKETPVGYYELTYAIDVTAP